MSSKKPQKPATKTVTAGRRSALTGPVVNVPVWRASTHLYENVAALEAGKSGNQDGRFFYGRRGSPTQWSLAEALTEMEPGAHGTMLYPSGVAAVACALLSVLKSGDVLLMTDNAYDPSRSLADGFLKRFGVETRYFDPLASDYDALFCDRTKAILLESPGSLTFEMQDIPAICAAAQKHNVVTLLDNTWATPYFHTALDKGIDMAILSCTKYIVGHSDVMMGSVTTHEKYWTRLRQTAQQLGQTVSPDDAYLASRGLRTLSVRMKAHEASALQIAKWLQTQPDVAAVFHPALPECPGHDIWKRDFNGSAGLFSFIHKGDAATAAAFVDALELFGIGYSWGGFESLALPVQPEKYRSIVSWDEEGTLIRLQIGLEDTDDLVADLDQAFTAARSGA
ncbi:MAG: cystathionine beta-lyase [Sphingorhabdus sp.]|uniref:cystathionine beta-lyase n=2 Tax=Sphingorhabdus sp. TaxID=1902408 RepID=UPI00273DD4EC|nr:cystathionine beta-lyase [Sphingorhabdus sp.]MDP4757522.1 cystathionine beta-lyase [Sphingorhabdus sp.]MDP4873187.1 cystathionine beta-lyase [Sphingorhabdus sp.]MDP4927289.1 cystathionine beta-lyase [Sphingorhabdus sp.]